MDVLADIKQIVAATTKLDIATLDAATELSSLAIESIVVLRIIAAIERRFDIELDDAFVFRARTLDDLAVEVAAQRAAGAPRTS